jgi:hypothetical protein
MCYLSVKMLADRISVAFMIAAGMRGIEIILA